MMRAGLFVLLMLPAALDAATVRQIREDAEWSLSGAPCSTQTDIDELGGGDPVACFLHQEEELRLRPIKWHHVIRTF